MKVDTQQLDDLQDVLIEVLVTSLGISETNVKTILSNIGCRLYFGKKEFDKMLNESLNETKRTTK